MFKIFHKKNIKDSKFSLILAVFLATLVIVGVVMLIRPAINAINKMQNNKAQLIIIQPSDCADCFNIYQVVDFLKNDFKLTFTGEKEYKSNSVTAKKLIKDNGITVLPTFLIRGAGVEALGLDKILAEGTFDKNEKDLFVYKNIFPPYLNLENNEVKGRFDMFMLTDNSCVDCYDVETHKTAFQNLIINPSNIIKVDASSDEGKQLISDYSILDVPTIVLKGDLGAYQGFQALWETVGSVEEDGTYIFREGGLKLMGKYKNLETGEVKEVPVPESTNQILDVAPAE